MRVGIKPLFFLIFFFPCALCRMEKRVCPFFYSPFYFRKSGLSPFYLLRYSFTARAAETPVPTAVAICSGQALVTSPAANIPG
jgi:hypothetical protein